MLNKNLLWLAGSSILCMNAMSACGEKKEDKPLNILYIMTDDHSYQTISAFDKRYIQTPNIDRIANEGVLFRVY